MNDKPKIGPTGEFPRGPMGPDDEGGLNAGIAVDRGRGVLVMSFGKKVAWLAMYPNEAREWAKVLLAKADELDGGAGRG